MVERVNDLQEKFSLNPIVVRDLRSRMRGRRAFIILTVYLLILGCLVAGLYQSTYTVSPLMYYSSTPAGVVVGQTIFRGLVLLQLVLVSLVSPAFTVGSIAGERERKTYALLVTTLLPARSIIMGKLGAALVYVILLILTSLPLESIAFLFGGVALSELLIASVGLLVTALGFGSIGMFYSSITRSSTMATVLTYITVLLTLFALPLLGFVFVLPIAAIGASPFDDPTLPVLIILIYGLGFLASINPFLSAIITETLILEGRSLFFFTETIDSHTIYLVNPWLVYVVFYILLSLFLILFSIRRVGRTDKT
jgi:ABC-2 type transport system permease protein